MKTLTLFLLFSIATVVMFAQVSGNNPRERIRDSGLNDIEERKTLAVNVGVLMGGGSLIGMDFEYMPTKRIGIQAGIGISSFGFGVNYHVKDMINSSFISLVFWQQGWGESHYASYVGPLFSLRLKKVLQAGVGYGIVVDKGPAIRGTKYKNMTSSLLFNIGIFLPLN